MGARAAGAVPALGDSAGGASRAGSGGGGGGGRGGGRSIEEAARDLGAGPWTTFRLDTLPMIFPGVLSAALLAFALSIDEYIITTFNAGSMVTFPLWVFGATKLGVPPQVNVLATIVFVGGLLLTVLNAFLLRRRRN